MPAWRASMTRFLVGVAIGLSLGVLAVVVFVAWATAKGETR